MERHYSKPHRDKVLIHERDKQVSTKEISNPADFARLEEFISTFERAVNRDGSTEYWGMGEVYAIRLFLKKFLEGFGIPSHGRVTAALQEADSNPNDHWLFGIQGPSARYVIENARRMLALERRKPGIVRYLYSQRGIRNFNRFSLTFWLRQYAERESDLPCMVVMVPSSLEKEALAATAVYTHLQDLLAQQETPHIMRMLEIYNVPDALRLLVRFDRAYSPTGKNPIAGVLFDGHGTSQRVFLSGDDENGLFGIRQLRSERFEELFKKYLSKAFSPAAQFTFGSCEAGRTSDGRSIGHELKTVMQSIFSKRVKVVASKNSLFPFSELIPSLGKDGSLRITCVTEGFDNDTGETDRQRLRQL